MNVKDFISQLKSLKPNKRVDFFKQHLQDEFWSDVVKSKSYALQIFRYCCVSSDVNTCIEVFDILGRKGCFMRIIQKFDETHVVDKNILSILKICPELLSNWFSGPLKFETSDTFFTFLVYCSEYTGKLNLVGNIEQFLKYDTIKLFNFYSLQSALTQSRKYNKQTYIYILKLISEANADIIKFFNSNHKVEGDIEAFIQGVPELFIILNPPFVFDDVMQFINMAFNIWVAYKYDDGDDGTTRIFKYIDDHIDMIQFTSSPTTSTFDAGAAIYYLGDLLELNLLRTYKLLIKQIGRNTKYLDEIYTRVQSNITYHCKQIHKDLEHVFYSQLTDDTITTDDIKDLFDI